MSKEANDQMTVLVVEDQGELRSMMRRRLKEMGYRVLTAQDGEEAAELVECLACQGPQLIVTELQMPGLSSLIEFAAEHPRLRHILLAAVEPEYVGAHDGRVTVVKDYEELNNLLR